MQYEGKKRNRTHTKIMHVAKRLFEEKGMENVTADDIADASEVCRSTFFNHFGSIRDLLLQIAGEEIEDLLCVKKKGLRGEALINALMCKLVDDTVNYPYLFTKLTTTCIASREENNALQRVERLLYDELSTLSLDASFTTEERVALIMGAYYGGVNSFLINNKAFGDGGEIKLLIVKLTRLLCSAGAAY